MQPIVVLAGGVGAARFLQGVTASMRVRDVTIIGNVGDDSEFAGLHVSPDLDTVLYTLTGQIDEDRGWGVRGDSARALERARSLGQDAWFWLGDLDIGLHMARTEWLHAGVPLSEVTRRLSSALGLDDRLVPATDGRLRTIIETAEGDLDFQTYYVRRQHRDDVIGIRWEGAGVAVPAPGVLEALDAAAAVVIAPSNPLISIGPILAVRGIAERLRARSVPCVAISPIVGGQALRGPAADMMRTLGHDPSPTGVAGIYRGLVDTMVIDAVDADHAAGVERHGMAVTVTDTIMRDAASRQRLATVALEAAGVRVPQ